MYLTGLEIAGIVGAGLGGLGSAAAGVASAVGGNAMSKRKDVADIARLNSRLQKEQMDYQNSLQVANFERQLAEQYKYDTYKYKNYDSLQAQVEDAKAAGLAPEVVAGGASSGSSGGSVGSIGGVSIPGTSVDAVGYMNNKEQQKQNSLRQIQGAFQTMADIGPKLAQIGHEQEARNHQREVWKFENTMMQQQIQEKALDLSRKAFGNSKLQERYNREVLGFEFQQRSEKRQQEAHNAQQSLNRLAYFHNLEQGIQQRDQHEMNMAKDFMTLLLSGEDLTEKRWRNRYMETYGRYPEKNMSLGEAISDAMRAMSGDSSTVTGNIVAGLKRQYQDENGDFDYSKALGHPLTWFIPGLGLVKGFKFARIGYKGYKAYKAYRAAKSLEKAKKAWNIYKSSSTYGPSSFNPYQ